MSKNFKLKIEHHHTDQFIDFGEVRASDWTVVYELAEGLAQMMQPIELDLHDGYGTREVEWRSDVEEL